MFKLFFKDFKLQKKLFVFLILYAVLFGFVFGGEEGQSFVNLILPVGTLLLVTNPWRYDEYYEMEKVLVSLPVKRSDLVFSKYVNSIIYMVLISGIVFLLAFIGKYFDIKFLKEAFNINIPGYIFTLSTTMLMISLSFPLFFKYGIRKGKIARGLFGLFGGCFAILIAANQMNFVQKIYGDGMYALILLIISSLIYLISLSCSIKVYEKKEI